MPLSGGSIGLPRRPARAGARDPKAAYFFRNRTSCSNGHFVRPVRRKPRESGVRIDVCRGRMRNPPPTMRATRRRRASLTPPLTA
jgi:hypothetical protein